MCGQNTSYFLFSLTTVIFLSWSLTFVQSDLCTKRPQCCKKGAPGGYTELDNPRRSTESVFKAGQSAICDRALTWGWYRFVSYVGGKMPEKNKIAEMRCGTVHPIWMKESHPTFSEGTVDRTACINFYDLNNGCFTSLKIKVTNCNGFFVYYLGPTHTCSLAYCAGFRKPCPYGQKLQGTPPTCKAIQPKKFDSKNLDTPKIKTIPNSVSLLCTVELLNNIEQEGKVEYLIEWFADGNVLQFNTPKCAKQNNSACPSPDTSISSKLQGKDYTAGKWITCKVKAKFKDSKDWCTPKEANKPFYAGIEVSPSTLSLDLQSCKPNVGKNKIKIQATVPVLKHPVTEEFLKVSFNLPVGLKVDDGQCDFQLKGTSPKEVTILPDCSALKENRHETKVIVIKFLGGGSFWFPHSTVRTIWVSVTEKKVEQCMTFTDPHYHGMAPIGTTRPFDFMGHGDFILYKNDEKKFEVHTRQWSCNRAGVTCNCGAVLRDHNDVIEFNCCNKDLRFQNQHPTPLQVKLRSAKCLRPGIYVGKKSNGGNDDYTVIFPTGVKVDIVRNYWGIDVTILTTRHTQDTGICINQGSQPRLDYGKSFFDVLPPKVDDKDAMYASVCTCRKDKCNPADGVNSFHVPSFMRNNKTPYNLCDRAFKRDIHYSDELTDEDFELFKSPLPYEPQNRFKRALPSPVIPKQNATRYCTEKIKNTKVGKLCSDIGVNVQGYVDSCSLDVSLTGDFSFALGIAAMLTSECGYTAAINASSYKNESSNEGQAVNPIENEIAEILCPNDCAFNGNCVNGSCVCYKDYTADDCSISIYQKPSLSKLQGDGLCDKRVRPCKKVTVMGIGWFNSTNITCHVVEFKVVNSSWKPNKTERSFPGSMVDLLLIDCFLPDPPVKQGYFDRSVEGTPAAGLTLSVSNDGIHKSNTNLTLITYDSACMTCNVTNGCSLKDDSCYINQYCFAPNEVHPDDFCYQCLPEVDKNTWTKRRVNHPPNITSQTAYYALYQENLELAFDVFDPEGMPVTLSLMDGSPKEAVMKDNVFYWNVTAAKTTTFYLEATDACQASSIFNFTVSLVDCQCQNNGSCSPVKPRGTGYYLCNCLPGFKGTKCETNIDECQSYPCSQGRCVDGINNYTCICDPGYDGRDCDHNIDDCVSSHCAYGNCTDLVDGYACNCIPGYAGLQCDQNIDECLSSPCFYGTCVDQVNSYNCQCEAGYTGHDCDIDIDECQSSPCINGNCTDQVNGFNCSCQAGFSGTRCEVNINDCLPVSCGNGTCVDRVNNYSCICNVGYTGRHCEVLIRHCSNDSCYPGVPCTENHYTISCGSCPSGFQGDGKNCKDIDDCVNHTCANGASCVDGINSYSCNCLVGFTGDQCKIDINDCVNHTCSNGGSCVDGINNYSCNCLTGFTGDHCETNIDDCVNHTCRNGGSCVDGINNYSCNCLAGFTGHHCEADINDCVSHKCSNGGTCVDGINRYSCNCLVGFTGDHCETDINDCVNHTCSNGGSCVDGVNSYSCNCLAGFTGNLCETVISTQHVKSTRQPTTSVPVKTPISTKTKTTTSTTTSTKLVTSSTAARTSHGISATSTVQEPATSSSIIEVIPTSEEHGKTTTPTPTSEERETKQPATKEPETEKPETELTVELRIEMKWNNDLKDETSEAFRNLANEFKSEIEDQYSQDDDFIAVEILSFKQGSVVVEFKLTFKKQLDNEKALGALKEGIKDGKMGSLKVDPESLKVKRDSEEPTKPKISFAVIIGISCGGVFLLALVTVCVIRHCQRRTNGNRTRVSDGMPAEVSFPKSEKYELEAKKEDIVRYEEVQISAIDTHYEELGISNEAVRYEKLGTSGEAARYVEVGNSTDAGQYDEIGISNDAAVYEEMGILNEAMQQ
ncbi:von Willebrand factor D and EGF domain-containing protein-like isoform X3 [Oculina patagonica]